MAQYRGGVSSDGPQSPISPLSQPSSSYSPSQSPGTSASMASSPQMTDSSYQQDIAMAQMPYAMSQQQQQQTQQLAWLVGKPVLASENFQQRFQQIKVIAHNVLKKLFIILVELYLSKSFASILFAVGLLGFLKSGIYNGNVLDF